MSKVILNVASALVLAYLIVEIHGWFLSDSPFALVVLIFLGLLINGFFNARNRGPDLAPANKQSRQRGGNRQRGNNDRNRNNNRGNRNARGQQNNRNNRNEKNERGGQNRGRDANKDSNRDSNKDRGRNRGQARDQQGGETKDTAAPKRETPRNDSAQASGPREEGTVKWFNRSKGFGFIIRSNGEEVFVHQRSIDSDGKGRGVLQDGQAVSFVVAESDRGPQAEQVKSKEA